VWGNQVLQKLKEKCEIGVQFQNISKGFNEYIAAELGYYFYTNSQFRKFKDSMGVNPLSSSLWVCQSDTE